MPSPEMRKATQSAVDVDQLLLPRWGTALMSADSIDYVVNDASYLPRIGRKSLSSAIVGVNLPSPQRGKLT